LTKKTAIIIATEGITTNLLYETLSVELDIQSVLIERPVSKATILKRRIKKIGLLKVMGQILFVALIVPMLKINSDKKIGRIIARYQLSNKGIPDNLIQTIQSVNDHPIVDIINELKPDIICINGTRIIKEKTLTKLPSKPINIHVGITPKYRGVHGGYWAKFNNDPHLFGTTLHYVDKGIDSGQIIDQIVVQPRDDDNFITYPILQYCEGLKMLKTNLKSLENTNHKAPLCNESQLFYHPTIWQYLRKRLIAGLR